MWEKPIPNRSCQELPDRQRGAPSSSTVQDRTSFESSCPRATRLQASLPCRGCGRCSTQCASLGCATLLTETSASTTHVHRCMNLETPKRPCTRSLARVQLRTARPCPALSTLLSPSGKNHDCVLPVDTAPRFLVPWPSHARCPCR